MVQPTPLHRHPIAAAPSPASAATAPAALRFSPLGDPAGPFRFELRAKDRLLIIDGEPVPLRARAMDLLCALLAYNGRLCTREQLLDQVWPGLVVEENNLSVQINGLRKLLGREMLATVPGQGYRLMARLAPPPVGAPVLHALPSLAAPAPPTPAALADTPPLIGRGGDLAALDQMVARHRLVSLVGSGGLGKTRLAQALLQQRRGSHPHGVCFVDLAPLQLADRLPDAVAAALGLPQAGGGDAQASLASLTRALSALQILVVLDNAEHLLDAVARLAAALLAGAPGLRLLVTSQAPLKLTDEWLFRLGGLAVPAGPCSPDEALQYGAVALFMARAQALDRRFTLTAARLPAVLGLCRRLDGSALAIELAAARLPLLGLAGLVDSLEHPLQLLTQGLRDAPARQQTLRAALGWSHGLLSPAEQTVFRRLAVFAGSASLAVLQQVLADEPGAPGTTVGNPSARTARQPALDCWAVLDALGGLVDRSLVGLVLPDSGAACADTASTPCASADQTAQADKADQVDHTCNTPSDGPRYRLLESPLALAREMLQASGEADALQRRHAAALQGLLVQALGDLLDGRIGTAALHDLLRPDIANAQAALHWALQHDPAAALVIAPRLSQALDRHRHTDRVAVWQAVEPLLDAAIAATEGTGTPPATAPWLATLAQAALHCAEVWQNTRTQHARQRAQQARDLATRAGDPRGAYMALRTLSFVAYRLGDLPGLQAMAQASRTQEQPGWSPTVRVVRAGTEAWLCMLTGDHDGAIVWRQAQAALLRAAGASDSGALVNIAGAQMAAGRLDASISTSRALADQLSGERDQQHRCFALSNLSGCLLTLGRADEAQAVLRESWPLAQPFGLQPQWADDAALVAALQGRPRAALQLAGFADAAFQALGQPREPVDQTRLDRALTLAAAALGAPDKADAGVAARLRAEGAKLPESALPGLAFGEATG